MPLGTLRVVKVRQKFLTTVAPQLLMERTERDWRQIMLHYFVGWIPAFVSASLLASLAFLQTYDRQLANQLELLILMLFVFAILTAVGLLIANLFREAPMGVPAERPARKPGDASITEITTLPKAQFGTTVQHDRLSLAVQQTEQAHDAILVDPPAPITIQTGQVSVVKIIALSMAVLMMVAFMVCSGRGFLLFRINQNVADSNPPIIIPEAQVPQPGLPPLDLRATILHAIGINAEELVFTHYGLEKNPLGVTSGSVVREAFTSGQLALTQYVLLGNSIASDQQTPQPLTIRLELPEQHQALKPQALKPSRAARAARSQYPRDAMTNPWQQSFHHHL